MQKFSQNTWFIGPVHDIIIMSNEKGMIIMSKKEILHDLYHIANLLIQSKGDNISFAKIDTLLESLKKEIEKNLHKN